MMSIQNPKTYNSNNNNVNDPQVINNDVKHMKYEHKYIPNDTYYGIGIENETYLMSDKPIERSGDWILKNHLRDRYCVDYWKNFKPSDIDDSLKMIDPNKSYKIPVFINSYTFNNCDKNLQHKTSYKKNPEPNLSFNGKTIHLLLLEQSEYFRDNIDKEFVYDGDTIEFTTLDFYKTTVDKCVKQLIDYKTKFINEINKIFLENEVLRNHYDSKLCYSKNFGLVNFVTNPKNVAICNNSTYHINITLPTKLNNVGKIEDFDLFKRMHYNAIRAIQWIEPMLIACYGSPDIFSTENDKFSKGSLRLALSRYISVGTYDTDKMVSGKLLKCFEYDPVSTANDKTILEREATKERHLNQHANVRDHWYKRYHCNSGYIAQTSIGFDMNYQKHYNHGIELRFFDFFPEEYMTDVINILLLVCQSSLSRNIQTEGSPWPTEGSMLPNPLASKAFDDQMIECIKNGSFCIMNREYISEIEAIFGYEIDILSQLIVTNTFQSLVDNLYNNLKDTEFIKQVSPNMKKPVIVNFNKIMFNMNKNFLYHGDYYYDSVDPIKTKLSIRSINPVKPIKPIRPVRPVRPVKQVNHVMPLESVTPIIPIEPVKPVEHVIPVSPVLQTSENPIMFIQMPQQISTPIRKEHVSINKNKQTKNHGCCIF